MSDEMSEKPRKKNTLVLLLPLIIVMLLGAAFALQRFLIPEDFFSKDLSADVLPEPERLEITNAINGTAYQVYVQLPPDYQESDKRYPVFYVLLGRRGLGSFEQALLSLFPRGKMPETIFVNVYTPAVSGFSPAGASGAANPSTRDYSLTKNPDAPEESGGAREFMRFIAEEAAALIDERYRTIPGDRGIGGYGFQASTALYSALTQPELFQRYIVLSPGFPNEDNTLVEAAAALAETRTDLPISLYMSIGENELVRHLRGWEAIVTSLEEREYDAFRFEAKQFPGLDIPDIRNESTRKGLAFVYGDWKD